MLKTYFDIKDTLCRELGEISRKGSLDREGLDDVYKLTSAITMVESLIRRERGDMDADEEYSNEGDSNAYRRSMRNSYDDMSHRMGNSGRFNYRISNTNRYEPYSWDNSRDDYSEARGRDGRTGRYVSRDSYDPGYSRHTAEQKVADKLEDMLDTTQDQHIRDALTQALTMLNK